MEHFLRTLPRLRTLVIYAEGKEPKVMTFRYKQPYPSFHPHALFSHFEDRWGDVYRLGSNSVTVHKGHLRWGSLRKPMVMQARGMFKRSYPQMVDTLSTALRAETGYESFYRESGDPYKLSLKGATGKGLNEKEFMIVKEGTIHGKGWVEVNNGKAFREFLTNNKIYDQFVFSKWMPDSLTEVGDQPIGHMGLEQQLGPMKPSMISTSARWEAVEWMLEEETSDDSPTATAPIPPSTAPPPAHPPTVRHPPPPPPHLLMPTPGWRKLEPIVKVEDEEVALTLFADDRVKRKREKSGENTAPLPKRSEYM